jgi:hypothetical protein
MSLEMTLVKTKYNSNIDYSDVADDLVEAYETFQNQTSNTWLVVNFDDVQSAREFVRKAQLWASDNELSFGRRENLKKGDDPTRVTFRIIKPTPRGSLTEEQKTQRAAARAATKAAQIE